VIDVSIVTWPNHPKRLEYVQECIAALKRYLTASQHTIVWHCSSESQHATDAPWCGDQLQAICEEYDIELQWRHGAAGLGENMNAALRMGNAPMILLVQDDMLLGMPCDLSPGVEFLEAHPEVDLLRYGWPGGGMVSWRKSPDIWRRFDTRRGWFYGDEPHLRRRSFMAKWGWYLERAKWQGESEGDFIRRLREGKAQVAAADQRYFQHKGTVTCAVNDPRGPTKR